MFNREGWRYGIAASQHRSIAASQHRSIAASQHRSIAASQHSIAASQHRSIAASASQHRSIAASQHYSKITNKYNELYRFVLHFTCLFFGKNHNTKNQPGADKKNRIIRCALLQTVLTLLLIPDYSIAADAVDQTITVKTSFDRLTPGGQLTLWNNQKAGAIPGNGIRGVDFWRCLSETDSTNGACRRSGVWNLPFGQESTIPLRFTEKRSKNTVNLNITAHAIHYADPPNGCVPITAFIPIHYTAGIRCYGIRFNGRMLTAYLRPGEYTKIPSGGIWEARLILQQIGWYDGKIVATWTANITLDVTDRNNGAIYLPAFGRADALVDLNLRTKPLSTAPGGEVSGSTVIDTCLYDGYNSNNAWLQVTLSDLLPPLNRAADLFSVTKTGTTGANPRDRVDYRVTMNYNGKPVAMENKKTFTLNGVDTALIRPVALPGFPVTVVCTPAPLTLTVQPFAKASKTAGRYSGALRVNLAARTLAP
ncbi:CfaE/CblD family pilus tip adhesin [Shimwellia blattae]|uniref:CfaE/CblD family pilus tip adhesin n=1 Tax=Shimwellia blattae TaxID=563 RepID=UPI001E391F65|nr:CfaE/CblD family pilus tip adhesin [Shimwellia blattae]